jgi:hypothetical protein
MWSDDRRSAPPHDGTPNRTLRSTARHWRASCPASSAALFEIAVGCSGRGGYRVLGAILMPLPAPVPASMIVLRDVPKFGLPSGAYFDHGSGQAQLTAMGARIVGFMFYLALSYGVVYFLLATKRSLGGWNTKEQLISPAIMAAIILIIAIGTMLVVPLPSVLLAVSLVAFAGYVRSSEALDDRFHESCHKRGFIWIFGLLYRSRVPKMSGVEVSWQRGGGRLNCRLEMRIRRS